MGRRPATIRDANAAKAGADSVARRRKAVRSIPVFAFLLLLLCAPILRAQAGSIANATAVPKSSSPAVRSRATQMYAALPMSFEANAGQTDSSVKFLVHAPGYSLFLTNREAVLSLLEPSPVQEPLRAHDPLRHPKMPQPQRAVRAVRVKFLGGNEAAAVAGTGELPAKSNYFIGNDPKQWHTNVPNYSAVKYSGIYPGVDAVFHGDNRRLEFDFDIAPGASARSIALEVDGARRMRLNQAGGVVIGMDAAHELVMKKPHIYQQLPEGRREIAGNYVLGARHRIAFALGSYDHTQPLVIDPTIVYATYLGGSGSDYATGIAVDSSGDVYVAGVTTSTDFPTMAPYESAGSSFVTKLNPSGSALVYSTYLGGASIYSIAIDSSGSAYVTGGAQTGLPTFNPYQADSHGAISNAFVTKLSPDGSSLVYSTYLGGNYFDEAFGIVVDSSGSAYVTGLTNSFGFPTTNPIQAACDDCAGSASLFDGDAFVTKFSPDGSSLIYSTYLGGSSQEYGQSIAVDSSGNAYITGLTQSTDFPTMNPFQAANASTLAATGSNVFVTKLNAAGSALVYSTYLGGADEDYGESIAVDSVGSAYVTGSAQSRNFPTMNPYQAAMLGANNAFVTKFNPAGSALVFSTYLGGNSATEGYSIALDAFDNVYVAGATTSNNFPLVDATQTNCLSCSSYSSAFVAQFNATGSALLFSTYLGGGLSTAGYGIAVDSSGNAYVAGLTQSTNFPTVNPFQATDKNTSRTAFIVKFAFPTATTLTISPTTLPSGTAGVPYSQMLTATGGTGTVTFAVTAGSLPTGLSLSSAGDFSGTPTQTGTFSFTVTATDANNDTGSQAYTLQIACPTITVGPSTLAPGTAGVPYGPVTFTAVGAVGATTFAATNTLPAGITFIAGVLSGETATQSGSFPFIVTATDSNGCMGTVSDTLVLNPGVSQPPAVVTDNETITVSDTETFPDVVDSEPITVTDTVSVTTSLIIAVPNVVGLTQAAATSAITGASLTVGTVTTASSATVPSGSVISQSPAAGSSAAAGSAVNLVVSIGPMSVAVPNVVGLTQAAATSAITGASLTVGTVTTASSATVPSGSVISQSPAAGSSAAAGSAVNLVVSIGPTSVTVSCTIPTISLSGDTATAQITCTATGPTGPIALVCNLPTSLSKYITCSFSPSSLSLTSTSTSPYTASTTLTIQAVQSALLERKPWPWAVPSGGVAFGAVLWLPAWVFLARRKKARSKRGILFLLILLCGLPLITSCVGKSKGPATPPAGTYQASIVLTGPGLNETITFTIQEP